ncbi:MAG TPA: T9SS type A sorting domain-containing protein, partial [Chitinophagales bacterium]|nr:T9SS type A sorting domain-containing protein [Chitinophagales bacterium]
PIKNILKNIFCSLLFFCTTILSNTSAQIFECEGLTQNYTEGEAPRGQSCSFSSNEYLNFYRIQTSWYPTNDIPIKYINIAITIRQTSDPNNPGNFSQNNPAHLQYLDSIIPKMNSFLSNIPLPSDPRTLVHYTDSRIRINRVALNFTQDDAMYGSNLYSADAVSPSDVINIFFYGDYQATGGNCVPGGVTHGVTVFMKDMHCSGVSVEYTAHNILHEIFHAVGLNHVYADGSCSPNGSGCICCKGCPPCNCWVGQEISNINHIDYLTDVFGNSGVHTWETYLYDGCIGGANSCNPFANNNDNCTNNFMGSRGDYISPQQIGRIHRNAMLDYHKKYFCGYGTIPYQVTTSEIWDFRVKFYQDIIVKAGSTLTISCEVQMVPGAKIIVEPNAKLIIDGGVITSSTSYSCSGLWQGIEVWGNSSQHQYTYSGNQLYQGFVEVKNGAVIENAATAIFLGKPDDWQNIYTGGIVQADSAIFRNNKRDIAFLKYKNFNPQNPLQKRGNLSFFRKTRFETTANLNDGSFPSNHVTMWNVDGVRFYGCTFENTNTNITSLSQLGNGIYTEDANFIVSGCDWKINCTFGFCCGYAPNIFRNLNTGIWAKRVAGVSYNYNIDKNNFINCLYSINNEGVDNAIITRNNLTIGKPRFAAWWTTGINFNTGTGYRIEENTITRDSLPNTMSIGTWLTSTGMNNNQVYKNSFTNITLSNYAYQRNRGLDLSTGLYSGLAYLCNTHNASGTNDIYIYGDDPVNHGIRQYQGKLNNTNNSVTAPAGNVFTRSGANSESDIANVNTPNITYFYYGPDSLSNAQYPFYVTPNRVTRVELQVENTCKSSFTLGGGFGKNGTVTELEINNGALSNEVKQQLLADYQTYNQLLNQYKGLYNSLIDGGNTAVMKQDIENSGTSEIWQLRQKLLGESPYLSKEVLKESSDKTNVLPDAVIYEIFAANPDGIKDEKLMKYLSEKVKPLPEWMIELLRNGSNQATSRTFLETAISNTKAQRDRTITYLVQDMISKQEENEEIDHPQLRSWLAAYQTPHGDYQIVDDYFETGNYSAGLSILSTIPTIYSLNEKEAEEFNGLQSLFNVLSTVYSTNRNIFLLNENERSAIQNLADNGEGIAKVRACNILSFVYGTECNYNLKLPEANHFFKTDNAPAGKDNPLLPFINAFPNPAKDYIEFSYNLPVGAMEGALSITDLKGMVIHKQQLTAKYGQIAIDTRQWQQGAYLYILSANGKMVANHKFVLIK